MGPDPMMPVRPLRTEDAAMLRRIRLEALETCPASFGASHAEAALLTEQDFAGQIATASPGAVFGAFDGRPMVGMAGLLVHRSAKRRHKAVLWGVYVQAAHAGRGLGRSLVQEAIALARSQAAVLQTAVVIGNAPARRLYLALGFRVYGVERKALWVDGAFHDEELLALDFS